MTKTEKCQLFLEAGRALVPHGTVWKHYKGGIYRVYGHVIDTTDGSVRIDYFRIGGPEFDAKAEEGVIFSRPIVEWDTFIEEVQSKRFTPVV